MAYHATRHAGERIYERTGLFVKDVIFKLENGLAVPLGNAGNKNEKCHWLFYSGADDRYFVAIINEETGDIITVLTRYQHRAKFPNTWAISSDALRMARQMWEGTYVSHAPVVTDNITVWRVKAVMQNASPPFHQYCIEFRLDKSIQDIQSHEAKESISTAIHRAKRRGDRVTNLWVRHGKKGKEKEIEIPEGFNLQ